MTDKKDHFAGKPELRDKQYSIVEANAKYNPCKISIKNSFTSGSIVFLPLSHRSKLFMLYCHSPASSLPPLSKFLHMCW